MKKQSEILTILSTITMNDVRNLLEKKHGKSLSEDLVEDLDIITGNISALTLHLEMERNNASFALRKAKFN